MEELYARRGKGIDSLIRQFNVAPPEHVKSPVSDRSPRIQEVLDLHDHLLYNPREKKSYSGFEDTDFYRHPIPQVLSPQEIKVFAEITSFHYEDRDNMANRYVVFERFLHALIMNSYEAGYNDFSFGKSIPFFDISIASYQNRALTFDPLAFGVSFFRGRETPAHSSRKPSLLARNITLSIEGDRKISVMKGTHVNYLIRGSRDHMRLEIGTNSTIEITGKVGIVTLFDRPLLYNTAYFFHESVREFDLKESRPQYCVFTVSSEENFDYLVKNLRLRGISNTVTLVDESNNVLKKRKVRGRK